MAMYTHLDLTVQKKIHWGKVGFLAKCPPVEGFFSVVSSSLLSFTALGILTVFFIVVQESKLKFQSSFCKENWCCLSKITFGIVKGSGKSYLYG